MHYSLFPSTQDEIKSIVKKMQQKTGVVNTAEVVTCEIAFIAAGIQRAQELNTTVVTSKHVLEGYNREYRISMEHALCKCIPSSVLARKAELRARLPIFDSLILKLEK